MSAVLLVQVGMLGKSSSFEPCTHGFTSPPSGKALPYVAAAPCAHMYCHAPVVRGPSLFVVYRYPQVKLLGSEQLLAQLAPVR